MVQMTPLGKHLLIDIEGAAHLADAPRIETALRDSVVAIGATLLQFHIQRFGGGEGLSAVAVLAESHMTIHTWPEHGRAALDVFVCGGFDPALCLPILKAQLGGQMQSQVIER